MFKKVICRKPKCTWATCTITCSSGCGENLKNSLDQALQNVIFFTIFPFDQKRCKIFCLLFQRPNGCQQSELKLVTKAVLFEADITNKLFSQDAEFFELDLHILTITRINMIENAFLSNQFRLLNSLSLKVETMVAGANTMHINRDSLNGLTSLVKLTISGEKINISSGILLGVSSTLRDLTLSFPDDSIDFKLLTEEVHMPMLITLTIRSNLKGSRIVSDLFIGVPNLIKLDLSDCKIDMIYANAFEPISNSLELLNLERNNLKSVPAGIFDSLRLLVVLKVNNNPWICSTELCEFQRYLIKHLEFSAEVECQTPVSGIPVVLAKGLCPPEDSVRALQCLNTKDGPTIYMASQNASMTILNGGNHDVTLKFDEIPHINLSLMWFSDKYVNSARIIDLQVNVANLNLSTSYIFCLIDMTLARVSPFNCLSHYLESSKISPLSWLTSDDKREMFSCFFGGIILCLVFGFIAGYFLIAQNPMLLKGSSKIIVIRNSDPTSGASTTPFESISDWNRLSDLG